MERLYPICRSITGDGVRATLDVLAESLPSSGTASLGHAGVRLDGQRRVERAGRLHRRPARAAGWSTSGEHNLHLVSYSVPVRATMTLDELRPHLHTLPDQPDWIPYRTTYYHRDWGFCLADEQLRVHGRGAVRGRRRLDPRAGRADLRGAGAAGGERDEV